MATQNRSPRHRVSAQQRREQMIAVAITMARERGVGVLTLARVAEASGVSKPIAYHHFGTLSGLLRAMYDSLNSVYEDAVLRTVSAQTDSVGVAASELRELCEAYVTCSLEAGALLDEIGAAINASGNATDSCRVDSADQYTELVAQLCGLDRATAHRVTVAFLGAADRICEAIIAGKVEREDGIDTLAALLTPHLAGWAQSGHPYL